MRVMKTAIPRDDGSPLICDSIQHDGKLWLVPEWLEEASKPYSKPVRMIGLSGLQYRSMPMGSEADFVLDYPVPQEVMRGSVQGDQAAPFVVLERPDVRIVNSLRTAPVGPTRTK